MDRLAELIIEEFNPRSIIELNDARVREFEQLELRTGVLSGEASSEIEVNQHGIRFIVNPRTGRSWNLVLAVLVFLLHQEADPVVAAWSSWLIRLSTTLAALIVVLGVAAWRRRPAALWRVVGDLAGVLCFLGTAARSASSRSVPAPA